MGLFKLHLSPNLKRHVSIPPFKVLFKCPKLKWFGSLKLSRMSGALYKYYLANKIFKANLQFIKYFDCFKFYLEYEFKQS